MRSTLRRLLALATLAGLALFARPSTAQAPIATDRTMTSPPVAAPTSGRVEALVGGRLIDGYGGAPLLDSVVVIEGEKIVAVGRQGQVAMTTSTRRFFARPAGSSLPSGLALGAIGCDSP